MPTIGQITETTANILIQLTSAGSDRPDNFTVEIAQWDTGSVTSGNTRTIVTGLTRTETSTINGGSLTVSPYYEIDGIGPMDYALITTATGDCHTVDTDQVLSTALTVYHPGTNGVIDEQTQVMSPATIMYSGGVTTSQNHNIALFSTLPFGNLGYYQNYELSGFTIYHEESTDSNGISLNGTNFENGPLQGPTIVKNPSNDQEFIIKGSQVPGISTSQIGPNKSRYRLTWDLSGNYTFVDFYWDANYNQ